MNHRLPGLSEYAQNTIDKIIMIRGNHTFQLQYSQANFSHMKMTDFNTTLHNGALHVACEFYLLPSIGYCITGHFECSDGTCILDHYVCDGVVDCPDRSDEISCDHVCTFFNVAIKYKNCFTNCFPVNCSCSNIYFHCHLGGCVSWSRVCDGIGDCPNDEDEQVCHLHYNNNKVSNNTVLAEHILDFVNEVDEIEETFQCRFGGEIIATLKNDLVPDCLDQSDETEYNNFLRNGSKTTYSAMQSLCNVADETTCVKNYPGVCYPRHLHCIYEPNGIAWLSCRNSGHLSNCQHYTCPSYFKCPHSYCIPVHNVCDGKQDCPNGEEERYRSPISCPGFLLCRHDKVCVHHYDIWDERVKCPQSLDDKTLQDVAKCPRNCSCSGYALSCTNGTNFVLPLLSPLQKIILLDTISISLDDITFKKGKFIFLMYLKVTRAALKAIQPHHVSHLTFLKELNFSHNNIGNLKSNTFFMLKSYNHITNLHSSVFVGAALMSRLYLNHNKIHVISHCTFKPMVQLRVLVLSQNNIDELGENILCSVSLNILDVSNNPLSRVDKIRLIESYQHLKQLNTSPNEICCHVPKGLFCYPLVPISDISSCRRLIFSNIAKAFLLSAALILLALQIGSIIWFSNQIRISPSGKYVFNILSLLIFSLGTYVSTHFLAVLSIDLYSAGHYSSFVKTWRHSIACNLLSALSYSSFQTTMFLSLLISCTRAIATVYPFKAQEISEWGILSGVIICFLVTTVLGYPGLTVPEYVNLPDSAFGLGFLLPGMGIQDSRIPWDIILFLVPSTSILLAICYCQVMLLKGLLKVSNTMAKAASSIAFRRKASRTSFVTFLIILLQYTPLLMLHILPVFKIPLQRGAIFFTTTAMLWFVHTMNFVIYVLASSDFQRFMHRTIN